MPAFSLKALLTHLYANCTTSSSSHARAFSRAEVVRAIPQSNHRPPRRRSNTPKLDGFISVRIGEPLQRFHPPFERASCRPTLLTRPWWADRLQPVGFAVLSRIELPQI